LVLVSSEIPLSNRAVIKAHGVLLLKTVEKKTRKTLNQSKKRTVPVQKSFSPPEKGDIMKKRQVRAKS